MIKEMIQRHLVCTYYVITLVLSFFLLNFHFVFTTVGHYSVSFTQFAPGFAVLFIVVLLKDKVILHNMKHWFKMAKRSSERAIPFLFLPTILIISSSFFLSILNIPYVSWDGNVLFYLLNLAAILIGCGAEEIGWRGFLLPQLQKKYSPFISSIVVGVLWGIWHLNLTGGILGFILYTVTIIEMSILMTWVFNKTHGNLLIMILWHFMFNLASHIFLWERFITKLLLIESIVFGIVCVVVVISRKKDFFYKEVIKA